VPSGFPLHQAESRSNGGYSGAGVVGTIPTSGLSRVRGEPNRREPIIRESPLVPQDVSPGIIPVATTDD
jgi:hypothetical protein